MAQYKINEAKDEIIFEGKVYKLSEIKSILKNANAELFTAVSCPNEVRYILSEDAKSLLKQAGESKDASS